MDNAKYTFVIRDNVNPGKEITYLGTIIKTEPRLHIIPDNNDPLSAEILQTVYEITLETSAGIVMIKGSDIIDHYPIKFTTAG
jgi:hypothetical protein